MDSGWTLPLWIAPVKFLAIELNPREFPHGELHPGHSWELTLVYLLCFTERRQAYAPDTFFRKDIKYFTFNDIISLCWKYPSCLFSETFLLPWMSTTSSISIQSISNSLIQSHILKNYSTYSYNRMKIGNRKISPWWFVCLLPQLLFSSTKNWRRTTKTLPCNSQIAMPFYSTLLVLWLSLLLLGQLFKKEL